jgi:hypothetical protein
VSLLAQAGRIPGPLPDRLLDDDDFTDGLTRIIRKTVRDYCTVGKRSGIDCWGMIQKGGRFRKHHSAPDKNDRLSRRRPAALRFRMP